MIKRYHQNLQDFDTNDGAYDQTNQDVTVTGNENEVSQSLRTENVNENGSQVYNQQSLSINGNENDATQEFNLEQTNDSGATVENRQVNELNGDGGFLYEDQPTARRVLRGYD